MSSNISKVGISDYQTVGNDPGRRVRRQVFRGVMGSDARIIDFVKGYDHINKSFYGTVKLH